MNEMQPNDVRFSTKANPGPDGYTTCKDCGGRWQVDPAVSWFRDRPCINSWHTLAGKPEPWRSLVAAPRIPHGPPPLTVTLNGHGISSRGWDLDGLLCSDIRVEVSPDEITTVVVSMADRMTSATYYVDQDFTISGTLTLARTDVQ